MVPRYAVINIEERDIFEKDWQVPYGYGNAFITTDLEHALIELEFYEDSVEKWAVEKIDENGREIIYRSCEIGKKQ